MTLDGILHFLKRCVLYFAKKIYIHKMTKTNWVLVIEFQIVHLFWLESMFWSIIFDIWILNSPFDIEPDSVCVNLIQVISRIYKCNMFIWIHHDLYTTKSDLRVFLIYKIWRKKSIDWICRTLLHFNAPKYFGFIHYVGSRCTK